MRQFCTIFFTIIFIFVYSTKGQVVSITNPTNTTPNLAATYPSLVNAITALNAITAISGPLTITLNPGNPQTAPAGGYVIQFATISNTAASPVTITGSGNTITAFSPQVSGQLYDAIFKLIGADYIILDNFVMQENAANTTTAAGTNNMTEWGVALLHKSATDGAQNNTIQNNIISLNRFYQNSFGIYSNSRHSATNVTVLEEITNNTTAPNNNNKIYNNAISNVNMGISIIGAGVAANMDLGNDIGGNSAATGNSITNWGGAALGIAGFFSNSGTYHGIFMNHEKNDNVSYNTIISANITGTTTTARGIQHRYASAAPTGTFTSTISNNTISLTDNNIIGSSFECILSEQIVSLSTATVNISNNSIINNSSSAITIMGINNTSSCGVLNINNNIFRDNTSTATGGGFTAISSNAAVTTTVNINNNMIGDASGNAITFSSATSAALIGINCSAAATTSAVSISNNNFQGFVQSATGSGAHTYIVLGHAPAGATTDNITGNTFTNITANTTANVRFISRTGAMALNAGATENCNNNSIVTGFSKPVAGGIVTLYFTASTCLSGNTMNETGNNFSNIILTGATDMAGWDNEEGGASGPTKTISSNTFTNWNCGDGAVNVIQTDFGGNNTAITGNTITNISTTNSIEGIFYGTGSKLAHTILNNSISGLSGGDVVWAISGGSSSASSIVNISGNDIHTVTSTGTTSSIAMRIMAAVTINISKNKIYDINAQNTTCLASGIEIATGTIGATYNISNNIIGDIKAPVTNSITAVRGISLPSLATTSTFNIYYNTVYLNASSSGTDFGSAALYLAVSGVPATGAETLRNNIFVNLSTANGAGVSAAYRRFGTNLTNYASASNNNIFYAGTPAPKSLIFYDGTNSDQTLAAFKTRVGPTREANSFTEMPTFLSVSGASANFLHLDPATPTQAESGAVNIGGYTDDYDGNIRQGNGGYTGTGTAPDIGADEIEGIYSEVNPPVITYTALATSTCNFSDMTLAGVNITDATGVPLSGTNRPRIYYRKNAGTWFSQPGANTSGTTTNSNWSFTIVVSDMGTLSGGDVVSYYIIAQDINPVVNVGSNPSTGLVATSVNSVTTAPTTPNNYMLSYNLAGTYTVGVGGNFTTLTAAVNAYNNACSLAGPTVFELIDNSYGSETFPIAINFRADANNTNTLTIRPSATAMPVITALVNFPNPIINLNGAKYINFDGRQGGAGSTKSFTITNTGTGPTIQFINDAQNDNLKYCIIKGQEIVKFSGTIVFSTANATGTGNDNNSIDNNDINESAGFSTNGIYSGGTAGKENDNISVTNNNISNYFNATISSTGIFVSSNSNSWTISGNHFFQTATRVYTAATDHFGIYIITGSGYTISNNVIGFANASGTGTTNMIGNSVTLAGFPSSYSPSGTAVSIRYAGIAVSLALFGTASTIDGNTVGGFAMYTASNSSTIFGMFGGIYVESGMVNIGVNAGNIIGATTGSNSIYVATTGAGGTIVGIRAACIFTSAIQNNNIGSIISSGTSSSVSGSFTGISFAGNCNYTVSNNSIGNADADNIQAGLMQSGANLSNTGTLTATIGGVTATLKGITCGSTGNTLSITNNTLRGWTMSCGGTLNTGIESSGAMSGGSPSVDVNNNFLGTATTNWLNATVANSGFFYGINITNTGATTNNIKNNDFQGTIFGTQNGIGGGLIKLTGATSANNIATISGNTFTNLSFRFSSGDLYFIVPNYTIASTGQLVVDNNKIVGNLNVTGTAFYHFLHCLMSSSAGAKADITNNDFSNIIAATGFTSDFTGLYSSFTLNPCLLTITNNKFSNWSFGAGGLTVFDLSNNTGTVDCSNNIISNMVSRGDIEGISITTAGSSGQFNIFNNSITNLVSSAAGGYIYGISAYFSTSANTIQTSINNNNLNGYSSTSTIGVVAGIYLSSGHSSGTVSVTKNKIYDLSESTSGGHVIGIDNSATLTGNITYSNNYIGDLRAPLSNVTDPAVAGMKLLMTGGQANVYYNTIHLNASGSAAQFSTAAMYADTASQVTLRNNIFSNISTAGASGKTVSLWRAVPNLGTYDASSNNNIFYAGTTSAQNLIYYDGTNSDQTITAYKARVTPRDNLSFSALPGFISTTGSNLNFLHLASGSNCGIANGGNNSGILLATDFDGDPRSITSPFLTDIGADEVTKLNIWTGANGSNWNDSGNWSQAIVPNGADKNVSIPSAPVTQPVIAMGDIFQVGNLIIDTGASLTNKGNLKIAGSVFADAASINNIQAGIVEGSVEMNGNCSVAQALAGNVFVNNSVKNFTVSNDVTISSVTGEHLNISRELSFGAVTGKTLNTGDNIVLLSTVNATANVADVTGNSISGKATVERYINTGLAGAGRHPKAWQFLATPTQGQTIFESWQESGSAAAGYGTIITGTGTGFDITTAQPSMKYYDPTIGANGNWVGVTNTGNQVNDQRGYMIFIRGDRTVTTSAAAPNPTIMRTKGTLYQPNNAPPISNVLAGKLVSVGNPYPSAINLDYMKNNNLFVNLNNDVVVWDPLLYGSYSYGGYQTLSAANNYEPTAGGTTYYPAGVASPDIQSGQAFFVQSAVSAGSVTFTEACKESSNRLVNRVSTPSTRQYFRISLFTNTGQIADGNAVVFDNNYRNSIDADDAIKIINSGENFGIKRDNKILSVEARQKPTRNDTVFYSISNLHRQSYQLRVAPKNMQGSGLKAFLVDKYLHSVIALSLSDSSFIDIDINSDSLSAAADRFYVVFKKGSVVPLPNIPHPGMEQKPGIIEKNGPSKETSSISIYPNPVENKTLQLHFIQQETGTYRIQLINNLGQPVYSNNIVINSSNCVQSIQIDRLIAAGNYLLQIYGVNGRKTVIQVVIN